VEAVRDKRGFTVAIGFEKIFSIRDPNMVLNDRKSEVLKAQVQNVLRKKEFVIISV
jgi:hypothetical protein